MALVNSKYHMLDYNKDELYTSKLDEKQKDPISVAVDNELFETFLFNDREAFPFKFEDLTSEKMLQSINLY